MKYRPPPSSSDCVCVLRPLTFSVDDAELLMTRALAVWAQLVRAVVAFLVLVQRVLAPLVQAVGEAGGVVL